MARRKKRNSADRKKLDVNARSKPKNIHNPLGTSGLNQWSGYVFEEFISDLRYPGAEKIYKEMSTNDSVISAILLLIDVIVRKAEWYVKPAGETEADKEAAKFVEECMNDMSQTWQTTITSVLSMLVYGFSFHEIVYKIRRGPFEKNGKYRSQYKDGKIGWRKMPIRQQSTLHSWKFDEEQNTPCAFVQNAPPNYKMVEIPFTKGLLFRVDESTENPESKSLLRGAYRSWFFKKRIEEIEGIGVERDLAGLPVAVAPEELNIWDEEDAEMCNLRNNVLDLIQGIRRDSEEGVLLPAGWELSLLSAGGNRQFNTSEIINRWDSRICVSMLADIILLGSGGDSGSASFALAENKESILGSAINAILDNVCGTFNKHAVSRLIDINGMTEGLTAYPCIKHKDVIPPSVKDIALLLRSMDLSIAKDMPLQNHLREKMALPHIEEKEFNEIYKPQGDEKKENSNKGGNFNDDDTVKNDLEMSGSHYTDPNSMR